MTAKLKVPGSNKSISHGSFSRAPLPGGPIEADHGLVKVRQILRMLKSDGWYQVTQRGSHRQFKHPQKPGKVTVAGKSGEDLCIGTWRHIIKQAGLR